jgi:hypothetical protein
MRKFVGPGKGTHVVDTMDAKGRLMRNVGMGRGDYLMYPEGIDNDKDGRYNEDGVGGLDLHRNYPYNWRPMDRDDGARLHAVRRWGVSALGARDALRVPVAADAPEHQRHQLDGHAGADAPARPEHLRGEGVRLPVAT